MLAISRYCMRVSFRSMSSDILSSSMVSEDAAVQSRNTIDVARPCTSADDSTNKGLSQSGPSLPSFQADECLGEDPYSKYSILKPTTSAVTDDELSDGAKLWLTKIIDRAERTSFSSVEDDLSPDYYARLSADGVKLENFTLLPNNALSIEESRGGELQTSKVNDANLPSEVEGIDYIAIDEHKLREGDVLMMNTPQVITPYRSQNQLQTWTLAPLVNDSPLLRGLVDLGVDLYHIDVTYGPRVTSWLVKLDFVDCVIPRLRFLSGLDIPVDKIGKFLTLNPWILKQDLGELKKRVNYLKQQRFSRRAVTELVCGCTHWLNYSEVELDKRLGWLQSEFDLTGKEVRQIAVHAPKLITFGIQHVHYVHIVLCEELGFTEKQAKNILVDAPSAWLRKADSIRRIFDYLHFEMDLSHSQMMVYPKSMTFHTHFVRRRHLFMKTLGLDQFDNTEPRFIPLPELLRESDIDFVENVAKSDWNKWHAFLKTL